MRHCKKRGHGRRRMAGKGLMNWLKKAGTFLRKHHDGIKKEKLASRVLTDLGYPGFAGVANYLGYGKRRRRAVRHRRRRRGHGLMLR